MIFLKGLLGGVVSVILAWIIVVAFSHWRWNATSKHHGELVAHAGGWNYLLHQPMVLALLIFAFGVGLFVASR